MEGEGLTVNRSWLLLLSTAQLTFRESALRVSTVRPTTGRGPVRQNHPIHQSAHSPTTKSTSPYVSQPIHQPPNQPVQRSVSPFINHQINQSIGQSAHSSTHQLTVSPLINPPTNYQRIHSSVDHQLINHYPINPPVNLVPSNPLKPTHQSTNHNSHNFLPSRSSSKRKIIKESKTDRLQPYL